MILKVSTSVLALLWCVFTVNAQDDNQDEDQEPSKRPSWSAGLPERSQPATLNKPEFKPEIDNEVELDMSGFGLQDRPQIELELPINEGIGNNNQATETEAVVEQAPTEPENTPVEVLPEPEPVVQIPVEEPVVEQATEQVAQPDELDSTTTEQPPAQAVEQVVEQPEVTTETPAEPVVEQPVVATEPPVDEPADTDNSLVQAEASTEDPANLDAEELEIPVNPAVEQSLASLDATPPEASNQIIATPALEAEYVWEILKREPVNYPIKAAKANLEGWVEVEITIDPAGNVVGAVAKDYSRKGRIFGNSALQSVNKWLFKPPSDLGITAPISRVYKIEFDL